MGAGVNKSIIAVKIAVVSNRMENRLLLIVDIRIEFMGKFEVGKLCVC